MAEPVVRPLWQRMSETMRPVTLALALVKKASPQSMRTFIPEGGKMAFPVTVQVEGLSSSVPICVCDGH